MKLKPRLKGLDDIRRESRKAQKRRHLRRPINTFETVQTMGGEVVLLDRETGPTSPD